MASMLLPMFAGAMQGQRDYDQFLRQKALDEQRIAAGQMELDQAKWNQANNAKINDAVFQIMARGNQPPMVQPPPQVQTPQPGQPSVPMQPELAPGIPQFSRPPQMPQVSQAPQQPQIPPYRSLQGAQQPAMQMPQVPPPPQMQQGMSLEQAAQQIKRMGITDPRLAMAVLDRLTPYLNQEAKQEAAFLRAQNAGLLGQVRAGELDVKRRKLEDDESLLDARRKEIEERGRASGARADKLSGKTGAGQGFGKVGANGAPANDPIEAAAWDYLIRGATPPKRGGTYERVMAYVGRLAKENGMSTQEIISASADVKSKLAAKKNFEVRAQNLQRAENQLDLEIPVLESAMSQLNPSRFPALANVQLAAMREAGDPRITQLDQAAETVFREFEGIVTGNPGTLNVQDVQNAHEAYMNARTPAMMLGAIEGMKRIIGNAKQSLKKTREEIMADINSGFGKKREAAPAPAGAIPSGWSVTVKP